MEGRLLLSTSARHTELRQIYHQPLGFAAARPDTPVLPYGSISSKATFIDTTVRITNGEHVVVGGGTYIAPYATLNAASGFIKIGSHSTIQDNATVISNPNHAVRTTNVQIGDNVVIGFGAVVKGPSKIGAFNTRSAPTASRPTEIGANAVIDGAVIQPGAIVGALAHVSGVVVPSTSRVLPGAIVTTTADLSNRAKVVPVGTVVDTNASSITATLTNTALLAAGYTNLYQGNAATGASPGPIGTPVTGVNNGNLSAVEGASASPANTNNQLPRFLSSFGELVPLTTGTSLFNFTARVIGNAVFNARPMDVQNHLGRSNSIRADLLPSSTAALTSAAISFGSAPQTGTGVTIAQATPAGALPIGQNLLVGDHAVILGGSTIPASIGNNVTVGSGAVVNDSRIGNGASIGARAYIFQSTIPDNATIPDGEILIRNVPMGFVQS
jgi:carbonic anhydrase/acetyltransferase-like protein (isoleucine patch superfamily)